MAEKSMSDNKLPEVVVFAGPNGSGKSTFSTPPWVKGEYVNADDIKRTGNLSDIEAAKIAESRRESLLSKRQTFTFETVLSTRRNLDLLWRARWKEYFVRGYFILTTSPQVNIGRVKERAANGLHDVPVDKIVSRYEKAVNNVPEFLLVCDICLIYDNTAEEPFRIVRKHKDSILVYENDLWPCDRIMRLILGSEPNQGQKLVPLRREPSDKA